MASPARVGSTPWAIPGRCARSGRTSTCVLEGGVMAGVIYLRTASGLLAMEPRPYDLEAVLQELLASDARLLRGASTGEAARRRWILITRESPIHGASGQSWSADHVFVDDQGVPTVVEVKRGSNTQLRREVVGQLLDYASNLAASTTAEEMRERFDGRIREAGGDPTAALQAELGIEIGSDEFWALVGENLARGRIRGYFVADEIPEELRRIVEYLNRQVGESRYLALEVAVPDGRRDECHVRTADRRRFVGTASGHEVGTAGRAVHRGAGCSLDAGPSGSRRGERHPRVGTRPRPRRPWRTRPAVSDPDALGPAARPSAHRPDMGPERHHGVPARLPEAAPRQRGAARGPPTGPQCDTRHAVDERRAATDW